MEARPVRPEGAVRPGPSNSAKRPLGGVVGGLARPRPEEARAAERGPEMAKQQSKVQRGNYPKPKGTVTSRPEMRRLLEERGRAEIPLGRGRRALRNSAKDLGVDIEITREKDRYIGVVPNKKGAKKGKK